MSSSLTPTQVLAESEVIIRVLTANPGFKLGDDDVTTLSRERDQLATLNGDVDSSRTALTAKMDRRDDQAKIVHDLNVRFRGGIRATYGPDSEQYDQVGGTRASERSSGLHRTPAPAPAKAPPAS